MKFSPHAHSSRTLRLPSDKKVTVGRDPDAQGVLLEQPPGWLHRDPVHHGHVC